MVHCLRSSWFLPESLLLLSSRNEDNYYYEELDRENNIKIGMAYPQILKFYLLFFEVPPIRFLSLLFLSLPPHRIEIGR